EIEQDDFAARRQLQVLRLDVAMHNGRLMRMHILKRVEQMVSPAQHVVNRKRRVIALLQQFRQILARNELHHQKLPLAFGKVVGDVRERRVTQAVKQAGLALERLAENRIFEEG